jgi:hypothetical protein
MKNILRSIMMVSCLLGVASLARATPASEIKFTYDFAKKILNVNVLHVSPNIQRHYIRRLEVYKNDTIIKTYNYPAQTSPQGLKQDVPLDLKPTDTVHVKAYCIQGGTKEGVFSLSSEASSAVLPAAKSTTPAVKNY